MEFVKRISTGVLFSIEEYSHLIGTAGYQKCDENGVSLEGPDAFGVDSSAEESAPDASRLVLVLDAINQIDPDTFSKGNASSPAAPKVAAVAALIGPVTAAEIKAAILSMG